ncbi:hypothetical protein AVEN_180319-1 [Araneus ventricosus]|uniref:Uncharacterized protein n=1 Tax=Araneus ventricosus TaxID=182803 RepID=A0A4Y2QZE0_ARAVE|nr:hypothetical protein AVEN_180319-1 [Araneus ventricosus]
MQLRNLFGRQLLTVGFLKLIDSIFHLQFHDPRQRQNLVDFRFHRYCLKLTLDNTTRLLQNRNKGSRGDPFPDILDHSDQAKMWK